MIPIRDTIPRRNPPIATWLIILANSFVFLFELALPEHTLVQFFYRFGLVPARYTHPAWALWVGLPVDDCFSFLTNMFLHGGWMHIIGNMWTLWIFGDNVEDRMGPIRFLFFYLFCGLAGGLVHWFINPHSTQRERLKSWPSCYLKAPGPTTTRSPTRRQRVSVCRSELIISAEFLDLMSLYPQPARHLPTVEYLPEPRRHGGFGGTVTEPGCVVGLRRHSFRFYCSRSGTIDAAVFPITLTRT
jgi:hypothetical protein